MLWGFRLSLLYLRESRDPLEISRIARNPLYFLGTLPISDLGVGDFLIIENKESSK